MILLALLSLLPPFFLALQLIPRLESSWSYMGVRLSLAVGSSIGISSVTLFLGMVSFGVVNGIFLMVESSIFLMLSGVFWMVHRRKHRIRYAPPTTSSISTAQPPKLLLYACTLAVVLGLAVIIILLVRNPHGEWDAWSIWNMRARFLFRSGKHWADAFSNQLAWSSHPDYPLLLPASIARVWYYLGTDSSEVPRIIAFLFAIATISLLAATISLLRGRSQACLAVLALIGTDYFVRHVPYQYADTPLSFFILAVVVLFFLACRHVEKCAQLLFLAGVMMGFAAWTKNEGLLFVPVVVVTSLTGLLRQSPRRQCLVETSSLLSGLLPILGIVAYFKVWLCPESDLIKGLSIDAVIGRVSDPSRYVLVARFFGYQFVSYGQGLLLILLAYGILMKPTKDGRYIRLIRMFVIVMLLVLFCFLTVYILTPHDVEWHLHTSAKRLLLQLLPMSLFLFFMLVAAPDEVRACRQQHM